MKSSVIMSILFVLSIIFLRKESYGQNEIVFSGPAMSTKKITSTMKEPVFGANGNLIIKASAASSEKDFDFLTGYHTVHHKKLKSRLTQSNEWFEFEGTHELFTKLRSLVNIETHQLQNTDGTPYEGMAVRVFNPTTRLWSIYWTDTNTATLDIPVVGSFENNIGRFFAKDKFNGRDILLQFQWDATEPGKPVWSQAFSADNGKTWEWNWYMYFTKDNAASAPKKEESKSLLSQTGTDIKVIELRNYLMKPGAREKFISFFEDNFIQSQNQLGGYVLGQYRVKGEEDNFFWLRGYANMASRSKYLPAFYFSPFWKQRKDIANSMIVNNDNVHLLKPLILEGNSFVEGKAINSAVLKTTKGLAVVEYYISNTKLKSLTEVFARGYVPVLKANGVEDYSVWISELSENDFPLLPVFQDKNLMVTITFYKDELEYREKLKAITASISDTLRAELQDAITIKHTLLLYPTDLSSSGQ